MGVKSALTPLPITWHGGTEMIPYIIRRLVQLSVQLFLMSLIVFTLIRLIPTDIVDLMVAHYAASPEVVENLRHFFGLDKPILVQYGDWIVSILRGDFGRSLRTGRPFLLELSIRLPVTLELIGLALVTSIIIGIPAGIISAVKRNKLPDYAARFVALLGLSMPSFWLGSMLLVLCSRYFGWVPPLGYIGISESPLRNLETFLLPSLTLGAILAGTVMRMTRSAMLEVLEQDYIRTARAKGLKEKVVILKHAMRNALIPVITVVGAQVGHLFGGAVAIEEVFSLPGLGRFVINSIQQRDYPVVQASLLLIGFIVALISLVVDLSYAVIDPRIKYR
jgi:peptide/nickel transport system permease protein